jgi:hypothetical protein
MNNSIAAAISSLGRASFLRRARFFFYSGRRWADNRCFGSHSKSSINNCQVIINGALQKSNWMQAFLKAGYVSRRITSADFLGDSMCIHILYREFLNPRQQADMSMTHLCPSCATGCIYGVFPVISLLHCCPKESRVCHER